jgi:hypothetical protein
MELTILNAIPEDGRKINTIQLTEIVYANRQRPFKARQSVLDGANNLIEKSDMNQEEWEIFRSAQAGQQPIYFWRGPRKIRA